MRLSILTFSNIIGQDFCPFSCLFFCRLHLITSVLDLQYIQVIWNSFEKWNWGIFLLSIFCTWNRGCIFTLSAMSYEINGWLKSSLVFYLLRITRSFPLFLGIYRFVIIHNLENVWKNKWKWSFLLKLQRLKNVWVISTKDKMWCKSKCWFVSEWMLRHYSLST